MSSHCCSNKDAKATQSVQSAIRLVLGMECGEKKVDELIHQLHHDGFEVARMKKNIPADIIELMLETQYGPIQAWRRYKEITKEEMATKLGISEKEYRAIDKEKSCDQIGFGLLKQIAEAMDLSVEQLDLSV